MTPDPTLPPSEHATLPPSEHARLQAAVDALCNLLAAVELAKQERQPR